MANLLHRLLRSRQPAPETEAAPAAPATVPEPRVPPAAEEPKAASHAEEPDERRRDDASRFEAQPKSGRGRRKTSDEISTIGPGEP